MGNNPSPSNQQQDSGNFKLYSFVKIYSRCSTCCRCQANRQQKCYTDVKGSRCYVTIKYTVGTSRWTT